ncbi:hypothetical protein CC2G_008832 [Coprinopsis cinerea AmutBmut pab1-1]|nr:hypothetical protein CC2G_008832 [Coprinopsis cinerea AmutBmut pab1-1]
MASIIATDAPLLSPVASNDSLWDSCPDPALNFNYSYYNLQAAQASQSCTDPPSPLKGPQDAHVSRLDLRLHPGAPLHAHTPGLRALRTPNVPCLERCPATPAPAAPSAPPGHRSRLNREQALSQPRSRPREEEGHNPQQGLCAPPMSPVSASGKLV